MKTLYLAGPIAGCDRGEANDWRDYVRGALEPYGVRGISPLRCEPIIGPYYGLTYDTDPKFGTARAIAAKNMADVRMCDMILAYMPRGLPLSKGTLIELGWARMLDKPLILVTDDPPLMEHPVVNACAGWLLETLDEAIEVVAGILAEYARPQRSEPSDMARRAQR